MYIFYYIPNFTGGLADFHLVKEIIEDTESRMCLFPKWLNKTDAREMVVYIHAMVHKIGGCHSRPLNKNERKIVTKTIIKIVKRKDKLLKITLLNYPSTFENFVFKNLSLFLKPFLSYLKLQANIQYNT